MDLETAKLVAFALWAESNEGVTGKAPGIIEAGFRAFQNATSIGDLRANLLDDLAFKLDNYLTVWEAAEEPEAPATVAEELDKVLTEIDEIEVIEVFEGLASASSEEQKETPAEEPQEPKKQRGKRGG